MTKSEITEHSDGVRWPLAIRDANARLPAAGGDELGAQI